MKETDMTPEITENGAVKEAAEANPETIETVPETSENSEIGESTSETQEGEETVGYSSNYYQHRMADAISSNNPTAYKHAKDNYAKALAKEQAQKMKR